MQRFFFLGCFLFSVYIAQSQFPFYYFVHPVSGTIKTDSTSYDVKILNRNKLEVKDSLPSGIQEFLSVLMINRKGRTHLEHLLTTTGNITINVSEKIGIMIVEGKYYLMAGYTGPEEYQSDSLVNELSNLRIRRKKFKDLNYVFEENSLMLFKGSVKYLHDSSIFKRENIYLFDRKLNKEITEFSIDTIKLEPLSFPDLTYRNNKELYYFGGIHEIRHTRPFNVSLHVRKMDAETEVFRYERKLFKKRRRLNRMKPAKVEVR